jgi:hypothetical protein
MRCTKCGTESTTGRKFCAACGSPLSSRCPKCGAENAPSSAFCEDCGTALADNAGRAATSPPEAASTVPEIRLTPEQPNASTTIDGERKTVTALFADIKGSMELIEDLDPEEARCLVDPALKLTIDAVHRYEGYVAQSTGARGAELLRPHALYVGRRVQGNRPPRRRVRCFEPKHWPQQMNERAVTVRLRSTASKASCF